MLPRNHASGVGRGQGEEHRQGEEKGRDYYALRSEWLAFAQAETAKGNPPKNTGAAFVAYCGKQDSLR